MSERGVVEIGQQGGGEDAAVSLDKIAGWRKWGRKKLKIHMEDVLEKRDGISVVMDALTDPLGRANYPIRVEIHAAPLASADGGIKAWTLQDGMDALLRAMTENSRLVVLSLEVHGGVSPTHEVLVAFVRSKRRQLRGLSVWEDGSEQVYGRTSLHDRQCVPFCVSSAFLPKFLNAYDGTLPDLTFYGLEHIKVSTLRYLLTRNVDHLNVEGNCDLLDVLEVSRRNTTTRKLILREGILHASYPSSVLSWDDLPCPVVRPDCEPSSELVLDMMRIDGNIDALFHKCRNYDAVTLRNCRVLPPNDDEIENVGDFPTGPCPELTLDLRDIVCWTLFHKVLETQSVMDLTVVFPDLEYEDLPQLSRFCRYLESSNIRTLNVALQNAYLNTIPELLASVAEMQHLETFHLLRAERHLSVCDFTTQPMFPSHCVYLLDAAKRNHSLHSAKTKFYDEYDGDEGEDWMPMRAELSYRLALNRMGYTKLMTAQEETMPVAAWPDALARASRVDASVTYSMLQNKLGRILTHAHQTKEKDTPGNKPGKVYACPANKIYLDKSYMAFILWQSAISKVAATLMLFYMLAVLMGM